VEVDVDKFTVKRLVAIAAMGLLMALLIVSVEGLEAVSSLLFGTGLVLIGKLMVSPLLDQWFYRTVRRAIELLLGALAIAPVAYLFYLDPSWRSEIPIYYIGGLMGPLCIDIFMLDAYFQQSREAEKRKGDAVLSLIGMGIQS